MIDDIRTLMNRYVTWVQDKTALKEVDGGWVEITTPFLDRHNDCLQIYARRENGHYILSDDGSTLDDLEMSGCAIDTPKRQGLLKEVLNGFGVKKTDKGWLMVQASSDDFPLRKHSLIQAMLAVNDLFYLAEPYVRSLFFEDVVAWMDTKEIRYVPRPKFTGQSGFDHQFDFVIPKSRRAPERIVDAITHPDRDTAQRLAFKVTDTKQTRPTESKAYAILNDADKEPADRVLLALTNYGVHPVRWSEREKFIEELAQ